MDTTTIVVIAIFACIVVAAFLVFRSRVIVVIKSLFGSVSIDASNPPPAAPPAPGVVIEDAKTTRGGILAEDETGKGAAVRRVEAQGDILASSKQDPKA